MMEGQTACGADNVTADGLLYQRPELWGEVAPHLDALTHLDLEAAHVYAIAHPELSAQGLLVALEIIGT